MVVEYTRYRYHLAREPAARNSIERADSGDT